MTEPSLGLPVSSPATTAAESSAPVEAPATATSTLVLEAPAPVAPVAPAQAESAVPIPAADQAKLDAMVASYLDAVSTLDPHSSGLHRQGQRHLEARRRRHPGLGLGLEPAARQADGGDAERRPDRGLDRQQVAAQPPPPGRGPRPGQQGDLFSPHKLLGLLPFGTGDRLRDYFDKYRSSQHELDSIITALYHGQDELQRDNAVDRAGEGQSLDGDGSAAPVRLPRARLDDALDRPDRRRSRRPTPTGPRSSRRTCCSPSARRTRTC